MRSVFEWFQQSHLDRNRPWLILGKGPTFSHRGRFDLCAFYTLGLNHVVRECRVTLAHAIDIEVIEQCGDAWLHNMDFLVMPWVPHVRYRPLSLRRKAAFTPSSLNLSEHCERIPVLTRLVSEGRVLWYNLSTAPPGRRRPDTPTVHAFGFSATAALNLLAHAGVKTVRSLGVDGGREYSQDFVDLTTKTLLVAGQSSYNMQFREFARSIVDTDVDFAPLDVETPIRIYVGAQQEQALALKVLEYSIRKHASMSVSVVPLFKALADAGIEVATPQDSAHRPRTPFSFQRFSIPAIKGRTGRAIYLDSDMQVFKDIKDLWTWRFDGADVLAVNERTGSGRRPQFSVMVLDCEALAWDVNHLIREFESDRWTYEEFVHDMAPANNISTVLPPEWNHLEYHREGETALTHYTDMDTQPWLSCDNVLGHLWCQDLFDAIERGDITKEDVRRDIDKGWVRPSLMDQLDLGIVDPLLLPLSVRNVDRAQFIPPHRGRHFCHERDAMSMVIFYCIIARSWPRAYLRRLWTASGLKALATKLRNRIA